MGAEVDSVLAGLTPGVGMGAVTDETRSRIGMGSGEGWVVAAPTMGARSGTSDDL